MIQRLLSLLAICLLPLACGTHSFTWEKVAQASSQYARWLPPDVSDIEAEITRPVHVNYTPPKEDDGEFSVYHPDFDSLFKKWQDNHAFNGNVLLAKGDQLVHVGSYGYAHAGKKEYLTTESVFQLASVTKMVTAIAMMQLHEAGKFAWDDPIKDHLPRWPYEKMTIRHLMNHTSGLVRYDGLGAQHWDRRYFMRYADVIDMFQDRRPGLNFRSGRKFEYCNSNYAMLAALVDFFSIQPFEDFVQENIFDPLGMESYYCQHRERVAKPNRTIGYVKKGRRYRVAGGDFDDGVMGDKGMHATVKDLYRLDRALAAGKLLKPESLAEAFTPGKVQRGGQLYGFGVRMKSYMPGVVYHFGWWRGYKSCFIRDLRNDATVIILSNRDHPGKQISYWHVLKLLNRWVEGPLS
ncbi:MAG: serine hydrolase domain-containing protein [Bacteroidota bacterium]